MLAVVARKEPRFGRVEVEENTETNIARNPTSLFLVLAAVEVENEVEAAMERVCRERMMASALLASLNLIGWRILARGWKYGVKLGR
jgi:hypothetical protein